MGKTMFGATQIYAGPSREDLFDALRLANEGRQVTFMIRDDFGNPVNLKCSISMLELEDGSGKRFLLKFSTKINNRIVASKSAYFSTETRQGWLEI
jgi:hypothetical protein